MTKHKRLRFLLLLCLGFCLITSVGVAYADTFNGAFYFGFSTGESLRWQDVSEATNITFTVMSGSWNGYAIMNCTDTGGRFLFSASSSGTIYVSSTASDTSIEMNHITFESGPLAVTSGSTYEIIWVYGGAPVIPPTPSPTPGLTGIPDLPQLNMDWGWIFLYSGDFLGGLQALFLNAFGILDLVYGLGAMAFLVPLYIRTKSLLLICIAWILLGSFFVVMVPVISGLAVLFIALGIGGLLYKVFRGGNQ